VADAPLTIRPFQPADQLRVRALVLAGLAERWGRLDPSRNPDLDDIQASYVARGETVLVAEAGGQITATGALVSSSHEVGQIVRMSVDASMRRQGVARRLVAALLESGRTRGFQRIIVETTHDWHSAIALYQQCGFVQYHQDDEDVYLDLALT
jgi:ribosomal protein S18 acetylase RimI-like enzyme